jgi:mono/diheme cytochrome c family protein
VFIPAQILYANFANAEDFTFTPGAWNLGLGPSLFAPDRKHPRPSGRLIAWDPVARQARWSVDFPQPWRGGVLATGGGLVFHAAGPRFIAFDAKTGKSLWSYDTGASAIAAASSYAVAGVQYVALMVGQGGAGGLVAGDARRDGRLLVFGLDGKAAVPPVAPATRAPPLDLTAATPSKGDVAHGEALWRQFCVTCHVGAGYLPLLPRSPLILEPEGFKAVVIDGARKKEGMAAFARFFDAAGAEDLRAYLLKEAARPPPTRPVEVRHPGS